MQIKEMMTDAHKALSELAGHIRSALHNENLADVVQGAANQCKQASEHADAEHDVAAVHEAATKGEKLAPAHIVNPELSGKPADPPFPAFDGSNNGVGDASQQGGG